MAKRHSDALAIQAGAVNPSGIALAIVAACKEIRDTPGHKGTAELTSDVAVRLMVHQLAFICNAFTLESRFDEYSKATAECTALAHEEPK